MAEAQAPGVEATPGKDVFVSYASQDAAAADAMVKALERHGVTCWIAPRDVQAGAQYADAIVRAIGNARAFVLVLSANAAASAHVGREVERAASKHRRIIALRVDAAPLTPALEYFLSESQWVEAQSGKQEAAYAKLIDAIRAPALPIHEKLGASASAAKPKSHGTRIGIAAGLGVLALALGALWLDWSWRTKHAPVGPAAAAGKALPASLAISDKSIAVLPFVDMSEKHDQEYLADGMSEEILNLLVKVPDLKVIGRTSSFQFKGKADDLRKIGAALGASYVVEGSVRKSEESIRVTAQLIDTRTGIHRWSETYDRQLNDALKVQGDIAASVARDLQVEIDPSIFDIVPGSQKSTEAYDLFLRGQHALDQDTQASTEESVADLRRSLQLDPLFVPAAASLAEALLVQAQAGWVPLRQGFEEARSVAEAALRRDPRSALAHCILGYVQLQYDWDWAAGDQQLQLALKLAPGNPDVLTYVAAGHAVHGEAVEALKIFDTAESLDPLAAYVIMNKCVTFRLMERYAEAERACRRTLEFSHDYAFVHSYIATTLIAKGEMQAALAEVRQEVSEPMQLMDLALVYHASHKRKESDAALARLEKEYGSDWAMQVAEAHAFRDEKDQAFKWLDRAYVQKDTDLYLIKADWFLKPLRGDSRYSAFLRKMKLA